MTMALKPKNYFTNFAKPEILKFLFQICPPPPPPKKKGGGKGSQQQKWQPEFNWQEFNWKVEGGGIVVQSTIMCTAPKFDTFYHAL